LKETISPDKGSSDMWKKRGGIRKKDSEHIRKGKKKLEDDAPAQTLGSSLDGEKKPIGVEKNRSIPVLGGKGGVLQKRESTL